MVVNEDDLGPIIEAIKLDGLKRYCQNGGFQELKAKRRNGCKRNQTPN